MIPYVVNTDRVSAFVKGKAYTLSSDNPAFVKVVEALEDGKDEAEVLKLLTAKPKVSYTKKGGFGFSEALRLRIAALKERGKSTKSIELFLENLKKNPSKESVKDLYDFLAACDLPITEDGCFLAYKRVTENFTDCHTGTMDNSVGKIVKMPRNKVNDDRNVTCSSGLHVCSKSYLNDFYGENIVVCKVNPKNVVSVPVDYNQSKMRVCEYEVIGVLAQDEEIRPLVASTKRKAPAKTSHKKEVKSTMKELDKAGKFNAYVKERNLPNKIDDMTRNQKEALKKFAARLLFGKPHAAGETINSCKTLAELKKTVCG